MTDKSIYEKNNRNRQEQAFGICLGQIVGVNVKDRTCSVSTFAGFGSMQDQYIDKCQWLSADANPEGDESGSIPRRGSMGLVFFVDGEAFIWGYLKPLWKGGTAAKGNEDPKLVEGDKIISTLQGNRIAIKRSGLIELYSSDTLRRLMVPNGARIMDVCKEYFLNCMNGGQMTWTGDPILNTALFKAEYRKDLARTFMVVEEKGYVTEDILSRITIGPALPFYSDIVTPTYVQTISASGEVKVNVTPPLPEGSPSGYQSVIGPDGSVSILAGAAQTTSIDVSPLGDVLLNVNKLTIAKISETGKFSIEGPSAMFGMTETGEAYFLNLVAGASVGVLDDGELSMKNRLGKIVISAKGDITVKGPTCTLTMNAAGEVVISAPQKVTIDTKLGVDVKSLGPINIEGVGPMSLKTKGVISIDGGTGATDFVLTNPTTISPFTGAPLVPFSTTVQVSK